MQAVLMEQIFYSIPKKMGFFEVDEIAEEAQKAAPRNSERESRGDAINDDNFKQTPNDMAWIIKK